MRYLRGLEDSFAAAIRSLPSPRARAGCASGSSYGVRAQSRPVHAAAGDFPASETGSSRPSLLLGLPPLALPGTPSVADYLSPASVATSRTHGASPIEALSEAPSPAATARTQKVAWANEAQAMGVLIAQAASPAKARRARAEAGAWISPRLMQLNLAAVKAGAQGPLSPPASGGMSARSGRPMSSRSIQAIPETSVSARVSPDERQPMDTSLGEWYQEIGRAPLSAPESTCTSPGTTLSSWFFDGAERPDGRTGATHWFKMSFGAPDSPDK